MQIFEVTSTTTIKDLCCSIASQLRLTSADGYGLYLKTPNKVGLGDIPAGICCLLIPIFKPFVSFDYDIQEENIINYVDFCVTWDILCFGFRQWSHKTQNYSFWCKLKHWRQWGHILTFLNYLIKNLHKYCLGYQKTIRMMINEDILSVILRSQAWMRRNISLTV